MKCLIIFTKVFKLTKSPWPRKYSSCLSYLVFMPSSKYWFSFDSSSVPCCDLDCNCPFVFFNFPTIKADHSGMLTTWHFEFIELCSRHSCSGVVVSRAGARWFVARSLLSCQTLFPQSIRTHGILLLEYCNFSYKAKNRHQNKRGILYNIIGFSFPFWYISRPPGLFCCCFCRQAWPQSICSTIWTPLPPRSLHTLGAFVFLRWCMTW